MQKVKYFIVFFNSVLFQCSKRCEIKLYLLHYYKRELQNIVINHSADIDYKDFVKIDRDCTKEPYNFLTIDTTQPIDRRFKKNFNDLL